MGRRRPSAFAVARIALWTLLLIAPRGSDAAPPETFEISADNGTLSESGTEDIITLNGNVRLRHGTTLITADTGRYLRLARLAVLSGHIVIRDTTTTIEANQASYYRDQELAILEGAVVLRDKDLTLTGEHLSYDRRLKKATATNNPVLTQKNQTLTAATVTYDRAADMILGEGRVHGVDTKEKTEVWGDRVAYNRKSKSGFLTGSPRLVTQESGPNAKTTVLTAREIRFQDTPRVVTALDSVRVTRGEFTGRGDTLVLFDAENRAVFTGHPEAWDSQSRVRADSLDLYFTGHTLDRARAVQHSIAPAHLEYVGAPRDTTGHGRRSGRGRESVTLEGPLFYLTFANEDVRTVDVAPPATGAYHYDEPGRPERTEINEVAGDTIHAELSDNRVERVTVSGQAAGTYRYYPKNSPSSEDRVTYSAPRIEFKVNEDRILLTHGAQITHGETKLEAPTIIFNSNSEALRAEGAITLNDSGDQITGRALTYELESGQGTIEQGRTRLERGFYQGSELRKVDDKTYAVRNAVYTTCDLPSPHYGISARQMKIQVGKRVIAKPVAFYIGKVPIFALPFYVIPIQKDRHSGMLFPQMDFGFSQPEGRFFRNLGYYWAPSQYWDATAILDYAEGNPYAYPATVGHATWRLSAQYSVRRVPLSGNFSSSYMTPTYERGPHEWRLDAQHSQTLPGQISASASANFASSAAAYSGIDTSPEAQRNSRNLQSRALFSRTWPDVSVSVGLDRNQILALPADSAHGLAAVPGSVSGTAPSVSVYLPTKPLGVKRAPGQPARLPFLASTYLSIQSTFVNQYNSAGSALWAPGIHSVRKLTSDVSLTDARRFGWLSISPSARVTDVRYDHDLRHRALAGFDQFSAGLNASATFYGYFLHRIGPLTGVRHVLSPSVSYSVTPGIGGFLYQEPIGDTTQLVSRFPDRENRTASGAQQLTFTLGQRVQMRFALGERVIKLDNLISTNTSASYDLAHGRFTGPIFSTMRIAPTQHLTADVSWQNVAPRGHERWGQFQNLNISLSSNLAGGGKWSGLAESPRAVPREPFVDVMRRGVRGETPPVDTLAGAPQVPAADSLLAGAPAIPAASEPARGQQPWSFQIAAGATRSSFTRRFDRVFSSGSLDVQLTSNWRASYSLAYDFSTGQISSQDYSIYRSLHCWEARFVRRYNGGSWEYYFRIGVKDLPEVYLEKGSRYIGTPHIPTF
jgi:lipopolysaccharide assembly outer membrane protein LptD (OstA)